jgi:transcriptional regulator with XRE-family HTH domain
LAKEAGVNPGTVWEAERGRTKPHLVTVAKIAEALGIPLEELAGGSKGSEPLAPPEQRSSNNLLEQRRRSRGEVGWPDERFRSAVAVAPVSQLKGLVEALVGNRRAAVLEDFGLDRDAAIRKGTARAQVFAYALVVREELHDRGEQDPREYLQDLDKYLEALGIDE